MRTRRPYARSTDEQLVRWLAEVEHARTVRLPDDTLASERADQAWLARAAELLCTEIELRSTITTERRHVAS